MPCPPDLAPYLKYLDQIDFPDEQKMTLIHTLYRTAESFVDRAFGADIAQYMPANTQKKMSLPAPKSVKLTEAFNKAVQEK